MKKMKTILFAFGLVALATGTVAFTASPNFGDDDDKCKIKIIKIVDGVQTEIDSTFDCNGSMSWLSGLDSLDIEMDSLCNMMKLKNGANAMDLKFDIETTEGKDGVMKMVINGKEMEIKLGDMDKALDKMHEHIEVIHDATGKMEVLIEDGEDGEKSHSVKIIKIIDGDEMDADDMHGKHKMVMISTDEEMSEDHEVVVDVQDGKEVKRIVIISKITTSDESVSKISKTLNGDKKELTISKLKFSPNPNDGKFDLSFKLDKKKPVQVKIVDIEGREVYNEMIPEFNGKYSNSIDISENGEGIYILQIIQEDKASASKIVIK